MLTCARAGRWQREPERSHAAQPTVTLADLARHVAREREVVVLELDVDRDERAASPDRGRAEAWVGHGGAEVRRARGEGVAPDRWQRAVLRIRVVVEERRHRQLVRDPAGERICGIDRDRRRRPRQRNERDDVDDTEPRVRAFVVCEREEIGRGPGELPGCELGHEGVRGRDREHRAVVVGVGVDVEQPGAAGSREQVDGVGTPALGDVDDALEHAAQATSAAGGTRRPASGAACDSTHGCASASHSRSSISRSPVSHR